MVCIVVTQVLLCVVVAFEELLCLLNFVFDLKNVKFGGSVQQFNEQSVEKSERSSFLPEFSNFLH